MPDRPALIPLAEHNARILNRTSAKGTGVACPACGEELFFIDNSVMTSNPPQRSTRCSNNHYHNIFVNT